MGAELCVHNRGRARTRKREGGRRALRARRRGHLAVFVASVVRGHCRGAAGPGRTGGRAGRAPRHFRPAPRSSRTSTTTRGMIGFGSVGLATRQLPQPLNSPVFSGVATPDGGGYLLASADGGVFAFG